MTDSWRDAWAARLDRLAGVRSDNGIEPGFVEGGIDSKTIEPSWSPYDDLEFWSPADGIKCPTKRFSGYDTL